MRYALNNPTGWAFDMSYVLYGGLFSMTGADALSRNAHVRGEVLFRLPRPLHDVEELESMLQQQHQKEVASGDAK